MPCGRSHVTKVQGVEPAYQCFDSDGVKITYIDTDPSGDIPSDRTALLVHGILSSSYMFSSGKNGCGLIDALIAEGFRVLSVDCRGHGGSDKPGKGQYGLRMVDDLKNLLDHLSLDKVHINGYSMGAEISIRFTTRHPSRVRSLCAGGSGWTVIERRKNYEKFGYWLRFPMVKAMNSCGCLHPLMMWFMGETFDIASGADTMDQMHEIIGIPEADMRAILVPVCGVMGEHDPEKQYSERMIGVVPDFNFVQINKRNHMTAPDDPLYNSTVIKHIKGCSGQ